MFKRQLEDKRPLIYAYTGNMSFSVFKKIQESKFEKAFKHINAAEIEEMLEAIRHRDFSIDDESINISQDKPEWQKSSKKNKAIEIIMKVK